MKQLVYLAVTIVLLTGLLPGAAVAEAPTGPTLLEQLPNLENWPGVVGANPSSAADDFVLAQAQTIAQVQLWSVPGVEFSEPTDWFATCQNITMDGNKTVTITAQWASPPECGFWRHVT